jgi:broad specificity phosphatase PhoE
MARTKNIIKLKRKSVTPYAQTKQPISKPYTFIYLIRHSNPDKLNGAGLSDYEVPLSSEGQTKRRYLTRYLKQLRIQAIYSSELTRAKETALELAKISRKKIIIEPRLNEFNWTDWHKIRYFHTSEKRRVKNFAGYKELDERLDRQQTRVRELIDEIWKKNIGKKVALFSHGNLIRAILTSILNADVIGFLSLEIYQTSITELVIDANGYVKISRINDVSHLPVRPKEDIFASSTGAY